MGATNVNATACIERLQSRSAPTTAQIMTNPRVLATGPIIPAADPTPP
jgi:hypothetical protein